MSLLRSEGHVDAAGYPLGAIHDEVNLVNERVNARILTEAELLRASVASMLSKKSAGHLKEVRDKINVRARQKRKSYADDPPEERGDNGAQGSRSRNPR